MDMFHPMLLRFLLLLNPAIGFDYGIVTENSYAFPKEAGVLLYNTACNDGEITDQDVESIAHYFGATEFDWVVYEQDIFSQRILKGRGFINYLNMPAMKYDLGCFAYEDVGIVQEIIGCDGKGIDHFAHVKAQSGGNPVQENLNKIYYLTSNIYDASLLHMYVAYDCDVPVAAGIMLQSSQNVATLHAIAVIPEARGKGFAKAIVKKALWDAQQQGCSQVVLLSSAMGKPLYEKIGFKDYANYFVYTLPSRIKKSVHYDFFLKNEIYE